MNLKKYIFDGSSLSSADRGKLIQCLDNWAYTGCQYIDIKASLYEGLFYENQDINKLPFPDDTIITPIL